jgi:hypothetical protein
MAGIDDRVRRQREQFATNPVKEEFGTAAGEVGPADAAEEHVAAEDRNGTIAVDEDDVTGRMTRDVEHFERMPANSIVSPSTTVRPRAGW